MSSATALTSGFAPTSRFASSKAHPPDMASLSRPQSPLGSAAVIAILVTIGLETTRAHSSEVKLAFPAISFLHAFFQWPNLEALIGSYVDQSTPKCATI